ncbi:hypothetical protein GW17_00025493 [Ensete ventricosum]|nr:hypothetical protein GW17_00025493 [Ensete ventricosum]
MSCRWRGQAVPEEDSVVSRIQRIQWWPSPSCSAPGSCRAGAWQVARGADEGTANGRMIGSQGQNPPPPNPENSMVAFALLLCSWKLSCCCVSGSTEERGKYPSASKVETAKREQEDGGRRRSPSSAISVSWFLNLRLPLEKRRAHWWGAMACGKDGEQKQDPRIEGIAASIRVVPDFPKKGPSFLPKPASLLSFPPWRSPPWPFDLDAEDLTLFKMMHQQMVGIMFQDITTLLLDPKAFKNTVDLFVERYIGKDVSVVAGKFLDLAALLGSVTSRYM